MPSLMPISPISIGLRFLGSFGVCALISSVRFHPVAVFSSVQRRLVQTNVIEHDVTAEKRQEVVVEADVLQGDHRLPVHRDVDVLHLDAEEQVAIEPADRQAAVHVVVGLPDDEAAQPFLEPGGLRDDDRHRRDADDQRADEGERPGANSSTRPWTS